MPWQLAGPWRGLTDAHGWGILQLFNYFCAMSLNIPEFSDIFLFEI